MNLGGWGREYYLSFSSIFKAAELYDLNETVHLGYCIVKDKPFHLVYATTTYMLHIAWRQVEPKLNGITLLFYLFIYLYFLGNIAVTISSFLLSITVL